MSIALGAMHKMFVDGTLTITEAVEEAKPQPLDHDTLRAAVILGIKTHAGGILRTIKLATYIAGATLLGTFAAAESIAFGFRQGLRFLSLITLTLGLVVASLQWQAARGLRAPPGAGYS